MSQRVLILGGRGRFGRHTSVAFRAAGWTVDTFDREKDDLEQAVSGVDVVINGWNPPDYSTWHRDLMPAHQRIIAALAGSDTTVIVPGNVYVFGATSPVPWSQASPHEATNPLGRLRIQMEAAYRMSDVRTILLRGGDFLDTQDSSNWFDRVIIKPLDKGRIDYPGPLDVPHAWAFLPDMARAAVALAEKRDTLPYFADVPFPGYTLTGVQIADLLSVATARPVKARSMAWWPLAFMSPVWPMLRGLLEMRYLWETPHSLDDNLFRELLLDFRETPVAEAFRQILDD